MELKVYDLSIDERFREEAEKQGKKLGWNKTAFTKNPAIKVRGLLFSFESRDLRFSDDEKMRLAAPLIIPMENVRKGEKLEDGSKEPDYKTRFTHEFIEAAHSQLMSNPDNLKDFFNFEHKSEIVPAYLREIWIVEEPETDKSWTVYGVKVPKGTLFAIAQITDREYYEKLKAEQADGFSIEGFFGFDVKMSELIQEYGDVVLLNGENKMLVLKRTEEDELEPGKYSLPGGKIEPGESEKDGAIRELGEETGIKLQDLTEIEAVQNGDGSVSYYFVGKTNEEPVISEEHTGFKWLGAEEIEGENMIFGQNERFKQLYEKAVKLISEKMDEKLPEGEHEIGGKIYVVNADGEITEVKEKAATEEMADEEKKKEEDAKSEEMSDEEKAKAEEEAKAKTEEMADEEAEAAAAAAAGTGEGGGAVTADQVKAMIMEIAKPMIDEAMEAIIKEVVKSEDQKAEAGEAGKETKELEYSDEEKQIKGALNTFAFLSKEG